MTGLPPATKITICDAYHRNPNPTGPYLLRCHRYARRSLTIRAGQEVHTLERCRGCRVALVAEAANGATFEILDETFHSRRDPADSSLYPTIETNRIACPACGRLIDVDASCPDCDIDDDLPHPKGQQK
jgi:hypothetical protein